MTHFSLPIHHSDVLSTNHQETIADPIIAFYLYLPDLDTSKGYADANKVLSLTWKQQEAIGLTSVNGDISLNTNNY